MASYAPDNMKARNVTHTSRRRTISLGGCEVVARVAAALASTAAVSLFKDTDGSLLRRPRHSVIC